MIASRTDLDESAAPPPVFPILPYAYMAYAEHCSHDYAHYVDRLANVDERPLPSQEALGLDMLNDMNRAFFALVRLISSAI